jgi:ribonuclease VapC
LIVIDTSALIAVLRREPEADSFLRIIAQANQCLISAVSYTETSLVLAGRTGDRAAWHGLDTLLDRAAVQIVPHDAELAAVARDAFLRFGTGRHAAALNFGDCASYALAKARDLPLLFKGDNFAATDLAAAAPTSSV